MRRHAYYLWGRRIESDFELDALTVGGQPQRSSPAESNTSITFSLCASGRLWPRPEKGITKYRDDRGAVWEESWQAGSAYVTRFPSLCSFRIFPAAQRIEVAPEPALDHAFLVHLALDHALPRLFSLLPGCLVLHASAVGIGGRIAAVLGPSGRGKSTLAAWFGARGYALLTDDCLLVERSLGGVWRARPGYRSVRLWPDSMEALGIDRASTSDFAAGSCKRRTGAEAGLRFASAGGRITDCFVLAESLPSGSPAVSALADNEAFLALAEAAFRVAVTDPAIEREEFDALTTLARSARFWSLRYPREYAALAAVENSMAETMRLRERPAEDRMCRR